MIHRLNEQSGFDSAQALARNGRRRSYRSQGDPYCPLSRALPPAIDDLPIVEAIDRVRSTYCASALAGELSMAGGGTIDWSTCLPRFEDAYAVAIHHEEIRYYRYPTIEHIENYCFKRRSLLNNGTPLGEKLFLGGWKDSNGFYLDLVVLIRDEVAAIMRAIKEGQRAIYHLSRNDEIVVEEWIKTHVVPTEASPARILAA